MENYKNQLSLFKIRNEINQSISLIEIGKKRFTYLSKFLAANKKLVITVLIFLGIQTIIEIILLLLVSSSMQSIVGTLAIKSHIWISYIILLFCAAYTIVTFIAVRYERTLVLKLINTLRRKLFSLSLEKEIVDHTHQTKADFIAKTSYHLSLLTMGIDNTLISGIRWVLYMIVLIVFSIVNKGSYINLAWIIFMSSIILFFLSYFISKKYISRQVASYSKIIRYLTNSMLEIPFIKNFHREKIVEKKLDRIVDIDTHFRIIRDTWIRYSSRVVYIFVVTIGTVYFLLASYYPLLSLGKVTQVFIKGIFYVYSLRILYTSSKAGLYFYPLRLGVFLSIPEYLGEMSAPRKKWEFKKINFKSNKIKLFKEGEYFKNISLVFTSKNRYLFWGEYRSGKTHLAALFAGQGYFSRHSWVVTVDSERFSYNQWAQIFRDTYLFTPHFSSDVSVGEVISGKEREEIEESDIHKMHTLAQKYPIFLSIFSKTRFTGESVFLHRSSPVSLFAIQTAYCIINKPKIIIIDNALIDLRYIQIEELIQVLEKELPESIIIIFSRTKNAIIPYTAIYEIKKSSIE